MEGRRRCQLGVQVQSPKPVLPNPDSSNMPYGLPGMTPGMVSKFRPYTPLGVTRALPVSHITKFPMRWTIRPLTLQAVSLMRVMKSRASAVAVSVAVAVSTMTEAVRGMDVSLVRRGQ
jgi:hypothetical protein